MEEEARDILRRVMAETPPPRNLAAAIRGRFTALGGVELELSPREPMREPPRFGRQRG
jgi:plasmid stability protein